MYFQHPVNHHIEGIRYAGLWVFLFGPLYFVSRGIWSHAIISLVLAMLTIGISWLVYPLFAYDIVRAHYLRHGWAELSYKPIPKL